MIITVFGRIIRRIEAYYKTSLLLYNCDKLEKVRELFQVSRRLNHIAQEVTLAFSDTQKVGHRFLIFTRPLYKNLLKIVCVQLNVFCECMQTHPDIGLL